MSHVKHFVTFKRMRVTLLLLFLALSGYLVYLDHVVREQFEGKRFALPARVYARPLELFVGKKLSPSHLEAELKLLRYIRKDDLTRSGQFRRKGQEVNIYVRGFSFWDGAQPDQKIRIVFKKGYVVGLFEKASRKK